MSQMNDDELRSLIERECGPVQRMGDMLWAVEVARVAMAAERERCAKKPLTAQQLDKLIESHVGGAELADGEYSAMVVFAAAVERAHGIGA